MDPENIGILGYGDTSLMIWRYKKEMEDNLLALEDHEDEVVKFIVINNKNVFTGSKDKLIKKWAPKESD